MKRNHPLASLVEQPLPRLAIIAVGLLAGLAPLLVAADSQPASAPTTTSTPATAASQPAVRRYDINDMVPPQRNFSGPVLDLAGAASATATATTTATTATAITPATTAPATTQSATGIANPYGWAAPVIEWSATSAPTTIPATMAADLIIFADRNPATSTAAATDTQPETQPATASAPSTSTAPDTQAVPRSEGPSIPALWAEIRFAELGPRVAAARQALVKRLKELPVACRLAYAESLIDPNAETATNVAAFELFDQAWGSDWLKPAWIRSIVNDPARAPSRQILVMLTYQQMGDRCASPTSQPTTGQAANRKEMFELAIDYLRSEVGRQAGASMPTSESAEAYNQQRLAVAMMQPVLTCVQRQRQSDAYATVWDAIGDLARQDKAPPMLRAYLNGWTAIRRSAYRETDNVDAALLALGHWDATVRWRAAARLAKQMELEAAAKSPVPAGKNTYTRLLPYLDDRREEVKAAAAMALSFNPAAGDDQLIQKLTSMLLKERSIMVQQAAASALMARSAQAKGAINPLLDIFEDSRPGRRRTELLLTVLANLAPQADDHQGWRMAQLAIGELPGAPHAALELLAALGNQGLLVKTAQIGPAREAVNAYLKTADRANRQYIERHVMPALGSGPATSPTSAQATEKP